MNQVGSLGGWQIQGKHAHLVDTGGAWLTNEGEHVGPVVPCSLPADQALVPAVTTWGLAAMGMLVLTAGTVFLRRKRLSAG